MLRRQISTDPDETLTVGDLRLDPRRRELLVRGTPVDVTAKEFDLLAVLLAEPGHVFTRAQLLERAFGFDYQGLDRTVDAHIRNLRRKIGDEPLAPQYIETVYGVGYRMKDACRAAD